MANWGAVFLICVIEAVIMLPLLRYIKTGWAAKRRDISDGLGCDACLAYFRMFSRNTPPPELDNSCSEFSKLYDIGYGRHKYIAPAFLLLIVSTVASALTVYTVLGKIASVDNPFFKIDEVAIAAMVGAYMWVVDDLISRSRRLDLAPSDIQWSVLRLVIAVPTAYAFASITADKLAPFMAFSLGAFPFTTLTTFLRRVATKNLNIEQNTNEAMDDIVKLQGIDRAIVERLANEDIRTITQLAYCDPVHITMRSSLSFNFVTDCMNQALAQIYFENKMEDLRMLGLRGAVEIKHFLEDLDYVGEDEVSKTKQLLALSALPIIATTLNQDQASIRYAFSQIADDPFTGFLYEIWT